MRCSMEKVCRYPHLLTKRSGTILENQPTKRTLTSCSDACRWMRAIVLHSMRSQRRSISFYTDKSRLLHHTRRSLTGLLNYPVNLHCVTFALNDRGKRLFCIPMLLVEPHLMEGIAKNVRRRSIRIRTLAPPADKTSLELSIKVLVNKNAGL